MMQQTVMDVMKNTVQRSPRNEAFKSFIDGQWISTSFREYYDFTKAIARVMIKHGLEPKKSVSILGNNCMEWFVTNMGAIFAGGVPVGIYATNSPMQCQYIINHSESNVLFVDDDNQLKKIITIEGDLPHLKLIITRHKTDLRPRCQFLSWDEAIKLGNELDDTELNKRMEAQQPSDCATMVYTSGTTGGPKGVMLSHHNLTWTSKALMTTLRGTPTDKSVSYLPLSHIAEQILSVHAAIGTGGSIWFCEQMDTLLETLLACRPTLFLAVPRVWEKMQEKISKEFAKATGVKKHIINFCQKMGTSNYEASIKGNMGHMGHDLANILLFKKIRKSLGLDQTRICVTSAAPISTSTLEFFMSVGIPICEVYGMSECSGPITLGNPEDIRIGYANKAIPGTQLKIAANGEILVKGEHVFLGYFKNPEATKATFDEDGWLKTGDTGEISPEGLLKVNGRIKDIIITAGGENIAPTVIEQKLKTIKGISQAVVVGDRRKFLVALLTLDELNISAVLEEVGSQAKGVRDIINCPELRSFIEKEIEKINGTLARVQTIKNFILLQENFSEANGELTPTLKMKRNVINEKYKVQIDTLYDVMPQRP